MFFGKNDMTVVSRRNVHQLGKIEIEKNTVRLFLSTVMYVIVKSSDFQKNHKFLRKASGMESYF